MIFSPALRAIGIPAATDVVKAWANRSSAHCWNVVKDTAGHFVDLTVLNSIIYSNQKLLYDALYHAASATLNELSKDAKFGTKTDFSTQINAIRNSGCDLVFIPIYAAEASVFLTQAKGKLDGMTIFGCDGLDGLQTKVSDTSMLKGTMMLTPFAVDDPDAKTQSFVEKFTKVHGSKPDQFAADAYDAVYAVKAAMESCGKTPADADFTTAMVDTMYKVTVDGLTGTMKWDADREPDKAAKAMVFNEDGTTSLFAE